VTTTRYAVYYAPDPQSGFHRRLSAWLGRDAFSDASVAQPAIAGFTTAAFHRLTAEPRHYGAHATLKPPFHPAAGHDDQTIGEGVAKLAATLAPIVMPPLRVTRIGHFLALTPERQEPALIALAATCVRGLDHLRAPPSQEELAKRRSMGLNARQEALLGQWGYPYVMEEFRFHITLSGKADGETLDRLAPAAADYFADDLEIRLLIHALTLFRDSGDGNGFVIIDRYSLLGRPTEE
jgi:putative phosphonate metabolism protein